MYGDKEGLVKTSRRNVKDGRWRNSIRTKRRG